jgi:hypothetical protein
MRLQWWLFLFLPAMGVLALLLWYGAVVAWALVLRRMAKRVSTWQELDDSDMSE